MPNIASVLKSEIARVARKEIRTQIEDLKKVVTKQRHEIAALKRTASELESKLKAVMRDHHASAKRAATVEGADEVSHRFSAKGMATNRRRLGLSAADFALLVGTTGQSIYAWEAQKSVPRATNLAALAQLRGIGKREVAKRLEELRSGSVSR